MYYNTILKDLALSGKYNLPDAKEMSYYDKLTIQSGISEISLIKKVAEELFKVVIDIVEYGDDITIIAGKGNNGSDGLALAVLLQNSGNYKVKLVLIDSIKHQELLNDFKGEIIKSEDLAETLQSSDFVIDAILGSGQTRPLYGEIKKTCEIISKINCRIISIDTPTGICTDSGEVFNFAVKPEFTIFIQEVKRGIVYLNPDNLGQIYLIDVGINVGTTACEILNINNLEIPQKKLTQHKKTYSDSFVVGGSLDMPGGHDLVVKSAIRSGAGYLRTFRYPHSNLPSEVIAINLDSNLTIKELDQILASISERTVLAIGSAMGVSIGTSELVKELIKLPNKKIIDADALNIIAKDNLIPNNAILTPHPKEASRLLAVAVEVVQKNRFDSAKTIALAYNSIVILKGYGSIITDGEKFYINPTGNPELATAGTGDVLTGILTGILSSGLSLFESAKLACFLHGLTADLIVEEFFPIIASDLIEYIPRSFKNVYSSKFIS